VQRQRSEGSAGRTVRAAPSDPGTALKCASASRTAAAKAAGSAVTDPVRLRGRRWIAGLGFDHDFAHQTLLVMADIHVERFNGLLDKPDWSVEGGFRKQLTPGSAMEAALGRHFYGTARSWILSLGASLEASPHI
jgi:hypothetical protein